MPTNDKTEEEIPSKCGAPIAHRQCGNFLILIIVAHNAVVSPCVHVFLKLPTLWTPDRSCLHGEFQSLQIRNMLPH